MRSLIPLLLLSLLLAPLGAAAAQAPTPTPAATPAVVHIYFNSQAQLQALADRLDVWQVDREAGWLLAYVTPAELDSLRQAGYTVTLDQARTRAVNTPLRVDPAQTSGIPNYPCYRTVEETLARLAQLGVDYPTLAQVSTIGSSWDKLTPGGPAGYDLQVITLTNSAIPGPKPHFFLMAEIHARELTTAETALRFAEYLLEAYGKDPDVTWLLDYSEVDILPMSNPDGRKFAEQGLLWRKNTDSANTCAVYDPLNYVYYGTDLNRNSSFRWGGVNASADPCSEIYRGPTAASEPEVQAIQVYVSTLFPARHPDPGAAVPLDYSGLFITLHSWGSFVLWPYGDTILPPPNNEQLQTLGRKLAYFNGYTPGQSSTTLYATSGTTDDWAYGTLGVPAYTFEMGSDFFQDCATFESTIWPQNRDALLYAFKAARLPYQAPAGPDVLASQLSLPAAIPGWSLTLTATASDTRYPTTAIPEPVQAIQAARYSIDQPPWVEGAIFQPLLAGDGSFDNPTEALTAALDTRSLTVGRHTIYLEAQDAAGSWGVPSAVFLTILPADYRIFAPFASK